MARIYKKNDKPVTLANVVNEYLKTRPDVYKHVEATGVVNGFFIDMKCGKLDPNDFVSIAYVGRMESNGKWIHDLNPYDKNFFKKLEKFIKILHNHINKDFGCHKKI